MEGENTRRPWALIAIEPSHGMSNEYLVFQAPNERAVNGCYERNLAQETGPGVVLVLDRCFDPKKYKLAWNVQRYSACGTGTSPQRRDRPLLSWDQTLRATMFSE